MSPAEKAQYEKQLEKQKELDRRTNLALRSMLSKLGKNKSDVTS